MFLRYPASFIVYTLFVFQIELPSVDDIHDESHYSIEDAKQKAEHDKMMQIAEEKKSAVRLQIAKLRTGPVVQYTGV